MCVHVCICLFVILLVNTIPQDRNLMGTFTLSVSVVACGRSWGGGGLKPGPMQSKKVWAEVKDENSLLVPFAKNVKNLQYFH